MAKDISLRGFYLLDMKNWKSYKNEEENVDNSPTIITLGKSLSNQTPQGNKIYFYSDVNKDSILNLNQQIDELTKQMKFIQFSFNLPQSPHIEIHICSEGGDVFAGMAAVDRVLDNKIPIYTFIEGTASSAATLLSVCGHKRFITKNSCALLHQISGDFWGNFQQLKDEHSNFELIMKIIKNIYLKKTKFKSKELDELLKRDLYLDSELCLKFGIVDDII